MLRYFSLEYWLDDDWYVGRLKEVPGVFSQGETLAELIENIKDAYQLLMSTEPPIPLSDTSYHTLEIEVAV